MSRVAIVGPVYPFRAGIAYCTTRLAEELRADVVSFKRQFPKRFYPGGDDVDPTLPRAEAAFVLDVLNPLTWFGSFRPGRAFVSMPAMCSGTSYPVRSTRCSPSSSSPDRRDARQSSGRDAR